MSFFDDLQPASFRGVQFGVLTAEGRFGRQTSAHAYPFRDKPWIEDLGRAGRKFSFVGFLISDPINYEGSPNVIAQREAMIAACETAGPGTLVHPTLGRLTVSCPEDGLTVTERWDEGRYFELGFYLLETGDREFPAAVNNTESDSQSAADFSEQASALDFLNVFQEVRDEGQAVIDQVFGTAAEWAGLVSNAVHNATGLYRMLVVLPGFFGRFFPGGTIGYLGRTRPAAGTPETIPALIAQGSADRATVAAALASLLEAAQGTDANALSDAAQAVLAAFLAAVIDPAVQIALLIELLAFFPNDPTTFSPIGEAMAAIQTAAGALFRRTVLSALVRACAQYQPTSRDDAASLRDRVADLIDAEITVAGDSGDDASFSSLRSLRVALVVDLNSRGAGLPPMQVFNFAANLPSLAIAQQLYQDASRSDELVAEGNPPHPAFMPLSFSALAS